MKQTRKVEVLGGIALVPLTRGLLAVIDSQDVHLVEKKNWHASKQRNTFYAKANVTLPGGKRALISMHRALMGFPDMEVDHKDGDGLNNRRQSNLRLATRPQNMQNRGAQKNNTSGFKGVWYQKKADKWYAAIRFHGSRKYLGPFKSAELASEAYLAEAKARHGDFAGVDGRTR